MRRNPNAWRFDLDPRDPDYLEPPEQIDEDDQEHEDDWPAADDPRGDGPYHYIPSYEP